MATNALAEYGAVPVAPEESESNPLAEYGAVPVKAAPTPAPAPAGNPLAEYGAVPVAASAPSDPRDEYLKQSNQIPVAKIEEIAKKHGADAEFLRSIAPFSAGVRVEEPGMPFGMQDVKSAAGVVAMAAGNLPQWAFKKMQDPGTRDAIDELKEYGDAHKSGLQKVAEGAASLGLGGAALGALHAAPAAVEGAQAVAKAAPVLWKSMAEGAVWGAASGLGESKEGEEVKSTAIGAGLGAALGGVLHGGSKALGLVKKAWGPPSDAAMQSVQAVVEEALERDAPALARSEDRIAQVAKGDAGAADGHVMNPEAVEEATQRLQSDPAHADAVRAANSDLVEQQEAAGWSDRELNDQLARRTVYNQESADTANFAEYLKSGGEKPLPRNADDLVRGAKPETLEEAGKVIQTKYATDGESFVRKEFQAFKASEAAADAFAEYRANGNDIQPGLLTNIGRSVFHGQGFLRMIDNRTGTTLAPLSNEMSRLKNLAAREMGQTLAAQAPMREAADKAGLRALNIDQIKAIEQGDLRSLSPDGRKAFAGWQDAVEANRLRMNELGVPVQRIDSDKATNYIMHMQVDAPTTVARVGALMRDIEQKSGAPFAKVLQQGDFALMERKAPQELEKLQGALKYLSGEDAGDAASLSRLAKQASNPLAVEQLTSSKAARYAPGALKAREGEIPDMLRETDLNKMQVRWLGENTKYAYMRESMQEMVKQRNMALAAGDKAGAAYVTDMMQDMAGTRATIHKAYRQSKMAFTAKMYAKSDALREAGDISAANTVRAIGENSDIFQVFGAAMYPNLIGLSPHIMVMQLTQPLLMTLPELASGGTAWASGKVMGGMLRTAADILLNGAKATRRVMEEGYMPGHRSAEMMESFKSGLERGATNKFLRGSAETYSRVGMGYMQMMEVFNRGSCLQMARTTAEDLMAGSENAHRFLANAGRGETYLIQKAINAGDKGQVEKLVGDYLVGKTMFHYDSTFNAAAGRFMGPLFSAFTTWPTQIAADVAGDLARRGVLGGSAAIMRKHGASYAVLSVMGAYLKAHGMGPDDSPRAKAFLGKSGLQGLAPAGALIDQLKERKLAPGPDAVVKGVASLMSGDPNNWWHFMNNEVGTFVPFTGLIHLLDTTIPAVFFNKEGHDKGATETARGLNLIKPGMGTRLDDAIQSHLGRSK
jgi:hypothetical protein